MTTYAVRTTVAGFLEHEEIQVVDMPRERFMQLVEDELSDVRRALSLRSGRGAAAGGT